MNNITMLGITLITALWVFQDASADELTIPNVFQPNEPARAAEVNANFDAVEDSVDDNASRIGTNEAAIQSNIAAISALSAGVGMPVYSNGNLIGRLVKFEGPSGVLIQSEKGYIFESDLIGSPNSHIRGAALYFSDIDCAGTLYVRAGIGGAFEWAGRTTGIVVRANGVIPAEAYYVARNSALLPLTVESNRQGGVCQNEIDSFNGFEAFPNDEEITGVPAEKPSVEFFLGVP